MIFKKKFLPIILCILLVFGACDVTGKQSGNGSDGGSSDTDMEKDLYTKSDYIYSVKGIGYLSGKKAVGYDEAYAVRGTDLGHPLYDAETDTMYYLHGDTFNYEDPVPPVLWRSNVIAYKNNISDSALSNGISIDGYISSENGIAQAAIEGKHTSDADEIEVTKIPRGGVSIGGVFYVWYMSVASWSPAWVNNYCGMIRSTDKGKTWERVIDATWLNPLERRYDMAHRLATQRADGSDSGQTLSRGHAAANFMQMFPVDGKDGYVYLFCAKEGIHCSAKLARVRYEDIEKFDKYEYYVGTKGGEPVWLGGEKGLAVADADTAASVIDYDGSDADTAMGEACVFFNQYLGKWVMIYHTHNAHIVFRFSKNLYEWSKAFTILDKSDYPFPDGAERTYGGFSNEVLSSDGGKKNYILVSLWRPYNVYVLEVEWC